MWLPTSTDNCGTCLVCINGRGACLPSITEGRVADRSLTNPQAGALITAFESNGHLGFRDMPNGNLEMDLEKSMAWLGHISQAWKECCCLIHISYGPLSWRVEDTLFQIMNMESSRRHLFTHQNDLASHDSPNRELIVIVTNYDETEGFILVEKKNLK